MSAINFDTYTHMLYGITLNYKTCVYVYRTSHSVSLPLYTKTSFSKQNHTVSYSAITMKAFAFTHPVF